MLKLQPTLRRELVALADSKIQRALAGADGMAAPLDAREALGATVSFALPAVADAWGGVLRSVGLVSRTFGVFSFGSPNVTFVDGERRRQANLADLLVVVEDRTRPKVERRAALVRARLTVANDMPYDERAERMAAAWPTFRFDDAAYDNRLRNLRAHELEVYQAEIELPSKVPSWRLTKLRESSPPVSLGTWLADLACGRRGHGASLCGADEWSRTVEDLRSRTAKATLQGLSPNPRLRSLATHRGARGSGFVVFEDRSGRGVEAALRAGVPPVGPLADGPISLVHIAFERAGGAAEQPLSDDQRAH